MNREDNKKLQIIRDTIKTLDAAVLAFCKRIGKPEWLEDKKAYNYKDPTSLHFQVLMTVRIASGLHASVCLLEGGYSQEAGAIIRTIEEFNLKILFIDEAHNKGKATAEQQKLINEFFKGDFFVNMDKICASYARTASEVTGNKNICSVQKDVRFIYDLLTKYIHGFYAAIMDMYDGGTERFRTNGMLDTPRIKEMIDSALAFCVSRALTTFILIADSIKQSHIKLELTKKREEFQKSEVFRNIFA